MLVDTHCHLDFPELAKDMEQVLAHAKQADIGIMQTICTKIHQFDKILAIAEAYPHIYCSIGTHPHEAEHETDITTAYIIEKTHHPKVIGIGETGLDFYYEHSPRLIQETAFRRHIAAARETGLPLIIHTRDADDDTIRILQDEAKQGAITGLIHCFSSTKQVAEAALELGFMISISGIITFKKADEIRAIVKDVPLDSLLVETDAPYLAPMPMRGKRNEPAFTRYTAEFLAELKGVSYDELAKATTANFFKLFKKAARV